MYEGNLQRLMKEIPRKTRNSPFSEGAIGDLARLLVKRICIASV
jgi:hypothetical protein